ncbi:tripartite tricarboxylate transporter substrate binding protein [Ruegeria pomeroyi]|uniref:Tricarboxylate transporter family protein n=2 Tax=Ruegeria pomeroyi TaxID=89184 RepID=Q5LQV3_RUEPO|nr:tripartite tricarboxylate transporter substrate binding protein [Ruegeria pomeroyi]HCE71331.1 tripartite tricarboxylate transporter substrate binding protein [Ruegeria sp.]AAV95640.1 tricarboxylate transporter family protein [Ruegeria pomeroyi DSS-3]NVK95998.1 tripartite tricarboxylate transporter substrate binding protein [Ruegeria pomeroyi]NVL02742.1 tripartite tricarboxylate transporter substrate binding protein [Ruegeria pomeroyi]QWV09226.1 tripartite tricarboxylate transporter substrat
MRPIKKLLGAALVAGLSVTAGVQVAAADEYPTKPIEMIIGFNPGGFSDAMARKLSEPLTEELGQTIVHTYMGGAGSSIAATAVKEKPADGYTLVVGTSLTFGFNPLQGEVAYTKEDFDYLLTMARFETSFVSLADKPWTDLTSMLEHAKETGIPLKFGSLGPADRLQIDAITKATGVTIIPLPIKGGANMMQSILGGHVDFGLSGGPHVQYVKSGEMIVLAASGSEPLNATPDAPTMSSLGYPAVSYNSVIAAPKGLPEDVRAKLEQALLDAANSGEFQELVQGRFVGITPMNGAETAASIDAISAAMEAVMSDSGS